MFCEKGLHIDKASHKPSIGRELTARSSTELDPTMAGDLNSKNR